MRCSCQLISLILLFFLLHLSSSCCHATSRNLLLLHAAASPSMAYAGEDHTTAMHVWRSPRKLVQAAAMAMESSPPLPPPDLELSGGVEDGSAAMAPFPADDGGGGEHDSAGGGDYELPKTHPPSHN